MIGTKQRSMWARVERVILSAPVPRFLYVSVAGVLAAALLATAALSQAPSSPNPVDGLAAWDKIAAVMQHPRCLNCHQLEAPLRGDSRGPHIPRVTRGPDDHGPSAMRCVNCHSLTGNNPSSGVPGAPSWALARATMSWQGLSRGDICRTIKDRKRNGNRSLEAIVEHIERDSLVLWAFNPGKGRGPIPIPHHAFVDFVKTWVASGAPCPA
ncbi:MAG: hypothetical protein WAM17_18255 [Rhodoplanes sp.]